MKRRLAVAEIVRRHGTLLVEDDPYGDLRYGGASIAPIRTFAPNHRFVSSPAAGHAGRHGTLISTPVLLGPAGRRDVRVGAGPHRGDMEALNRTAVERGTAFVPGTIFFAHPGEGQETLRLNHTMADEAALIRAIEILGEVFDESRPGFHDMRQE